jgi:selenocysteine lyase/cysteine desulfurase
MRTALDEVLPHGSAELTPLFSALPAARRSMAELLSCSLEEIAFVPNTSTGVHLVADGLDWQPGDEVVLFDGDFPANVRPWQRLAQRGVRLSWVPMRDGGYDLDDVAAAISPATRLIAVSHVNFATGFRCDLDAICRLAAAAGALVCVDAVQSLGVLPLSMASTPVDFLSAGAHKWLCAPPGTGVFYCRRDRLELLRSTPTGWVGFVGATNMFGWPGGGLRYDLPERQTAAKVEGGMYDLLGMAGLAAALAELTGIGIAAVADRAARLAQTLRDGLTDLGYTLAGWDEAGTQSGIVSIACPVDVGTGILDRLAASDIHVSAVTGLIRISPHYWTEDGEISSILTVLRNR